LPHHLANEHRGVGALTQREAQDECPKPSARGGECAIEGVNEVLVLLGIGDEFMMKILGDADYIDYIYR
jgi:hypothetical protein